MKLCIADIRSSFRTGLLALTVLISPLTWAGDGVWTGSGPSGGIAKEIAVDPSDADVVYALVSGAFYKTVDGGLHWTYASNGLTSASNFDFGELAIDPVTTDVLYLPHEFDNVFKSSDGGQTWLRSDSGIPSNANIKHIAIDPGTPSTLYALDKDGPVYRSTDSGANWTSAGTISGVAAAAGIVVVPGAANVLYAWAQSGLYRSVDSGATWSLAITGLDDPWVATVTVHPSNSLIAYAKVSASGLFKTLDQGATWTQVNACEGNNAPCLEPFGSNTSLLIDPVNPDNLYFENVFFGPYRSIDGGVNWSLLDASGFGPGQVNQGPVIMALGASNPNIIYAGHGGSAPNTQAIFRIDVAATTPGWESRSNGIAGSDASALAVHPTSGAIFAGGTHMLSPMNYSTDGGANWSLAGSGLPSQTDPVTVVAVHPLDPDIVYSALNNIVYLSLDGGANYTEFFDTELFDTVPNVFVDVTAIVVDPGDTAVVYVGTRGLGMYKTIDGGATWNGINTGFNHGVSTHIDALAIDTQNPNTLFAAAQGTGIYKTTNGGGLWVNVTSSPLFGITPINAIVIDPVDPQIIYLGSRDQGFKSLDGGVSWTSMPSYFNSELLDLAVSPDDHRVLYAAVPFTILRSADSGQSWTPLGDVPGRGVRRVALGPAGTSLVYAAVEFRGVVSFTVPGTDLAVALVGTPDPVPIGATITFTATVTNAGETADNVTFTGNLPGNTTFGSALASQGAACTVASGEVTCALGTIEPNNDATVTIEVVPNGAGVFTQTASVSGGANDGNTANNTAASAITASLDTDGDGTVDTQDSDDDDDTVDDDDDNCPLLANLQQENNDGDALGDICDDDDDNDTVDDGPDNCPLIANADQANNDSDDDGDLCDLDDDNDGVSDALELAAGLNPFDGSDVALDNDEDGFSNGDEAVAGSSISDPNETPLNVGAGLGFWNAVGPEGGSAFRITLHPIDPSIVYASSTALMKTIDGGSDWSFLDALSSGEYGGPNTAVVIHPGDPDVLFVATNSPATPAGRVAKSSDGGVTWTDAGTGLSSTHISYLVMAPSDPQTLYGLGFTAGQFQVSRTVDGGANWSANVGAIANLTGVAVAADAASVLYAFDNLGGGVLASFNSGETWQAVNTGLPGTRVSSMLVYDSQTVVVALFNDNRLWRTLNAGASWAPVAQDLINPLPQRARGLTRSAIAPETLYATGLQGSVGTVVYRSIDAGANWFAMDSNGLPSASVGSSLRVSPIDANVLYAGFTNYGVFKSNDGGNSWSEINHGFFNVSAFDLILNADGTKVFVETGGYAHFYRSANAGNSWRTVDDGIGFASSSVRAPVSDPINPDVIYAAAENEVWKTTDAGESWIDLNAGFTQGIIEEIVVDPMNPNVIYAANFRNGVRKSTNGGVSWAAANNGLPEGVATRIATMAIDPVSVPTTLYIGTALSTVPNVGGIYKSTNGGATWTAMLDDEMTNDTYVRDLVIDPVQPNNIYTTIGSNQLKSTDGGVSWTRRIPNVGSARQLAIDPARPHVLYMATSQGIAQSLDSGAEWHLVGELPGIKANSILLGASGTNVVFAAGLGVHAMQLAVDMSVTIAALANPPAESTPFTYRISVANAGPAGQLSVVAEHTLPTNATFTSATPSQGEACVVAAGVVTCALGGIGSGAAATIDVVVTPLNPGAIVFAAAVTGELTDLNPNDNTVSLDLAVDVDTDGDGLGNAIDDDDDGDGTPDGEDAFPLDAGETIDTDGDGIGNTMDTDDDGDGMPDAYEMSKGFDSLDPADGAEDADLDSLSNFHEFRFGSDPRDPESRAGPITPWLQLLLE